jgi:hypothetical protein
VATRLTKYELFDDGKHGDRRAGDGIYGVILPALTLEGGYDAEIRAQAGVCQGSPTREATLSFYPALRIDSARTDVQVAIAPGGVYTVVVTPLSATGLPAGPGLTNVIRAEIVGGGRAGAVKDNLNGSYTIPVRDAPADGVLRLVLDGTPLQVPLRGKAPRPETQQQRR